MAIAKKLSQYSRGSSENEFKANLGYSGSSRPPWTKEILS
jgi:hypothetical protein